MKIFLTLLLFLIIPESMASELDGYMNICKEIGFKNKTPAFGDCVLELRRRDQLNSAKEASSSKETVQANNKASYESQATEFFRRQEEEFQRRSNEDYARRLVEYERQKADYDRRVAAIEKEKKRQQGFKLLELGLRMGAGQSVRDASMATAGMLPIQPSMPSSNAFSPMENYRITTPSGSLINCRYDPNLRKAVCY